MGIFFIIWCLTAYKITTISLSASKVCLHHANLIEIDGAGVQTKHTSHDQETLTGMTKMEYRVGERGL